MRFFYEYLQSSAMIMISTKSLLPRNWSLESDPVKARVPSVQIAYHKSPVLSSFEKFTAS